MINWRTILYGLGFSLVDSIALPITKGVSMGWNKMYMIIPVMMYAATPFVFLQAISAESLTVMNLVWDLMSDIIITLIGLFAFAEKIRPMKFLGLLTGITSLIFLMYDSQELNEFLTKNFHMTGGIFV